MGRLPSGLDERLFKVVESHLRLEVLADFVRMVRSVGQAESFDVGLQEVFGLEIVEDQNIVLFAPSRFEYCVRLVADILLDLGPDYSVVADAPTDRRQRDPDVDLCATDVDVAESTADEDALAFVDDSRIWNNSSYREMAQHVQEASPVQGTEVKGLDRAVVGKQVKQGQQKKGAPRPVEVPGKKREHRQVDEESSQVDLRKRQPFNFIDRNFSADFKLSGLRDAEFI